MKITVNARHMEVTDSIRQYVQEKVAKLERFYGNLVSCEVILSMDAGKAVVEIVVNAARKHTFVATQRDDDLYASVDMCLDKITGQLRRFKDKIRDRQATPHGQAGRE